MSLLTLVVAIPAALPLLGLCIFLRTWWVQSLRLVCRHYGQFVECSILMLSELSTDSATEQFEFIL